MNSPKPSERCSSSNNRRLNSETKDDSFDNSVKESVKSERSGKSGEDWRRRTIIIEKKNGSYGFTLQSYGIHYKKEQEIEVITYVDHVEAEGAAAAAGMREGDVILSINGTVVERAEHAAIVDTIAACDARMRMVVVFEDCVRKVELHVKYINIQKALQDKMSELQQLTLRERQLFDNNWKSHSLPSQKKKKSPVDTVSDTDYANDDLNGTYSRPTLSSENVTVKSNSSNTFMYQYLDPRYGACFIQPNHQGGSFIITVGSPRSTGDCHYVVKTHAECRRSPDSKEHKPSYKDINKPYRSSHGQDCATCMPSYKNRHEANNADTYDVSSPCCNPQCIPNTKKKLRRTKEKNKEYKRKDKSILVDKSTQKHEVCSYKRNSKACPSTHCSSKYRYLSAESTQTSQCSLQSCSVGNTSGACDNSVSSYSTSLSSDTLFWDNDRIEIKTSPKIQYQVSHPSMKPKSWDNLTTKAFGGYGFGYGYLETNKHPSRPKSSCRSSSGRSTCSHHEHSHRAHRQSHANQHYSTHGRSHSHCAAPTISTESLILMPKYNLESAGSETRLACDCGDALEYYRRRQNGSKSLNSDRTSGHYTHYIYGTRSHKAKDTNVSAEITRL